MLADHAEAQRSRLFAIAYRMLGSATEAEDVVQDAYLRFYSTDRARIESEAALLRTIVIRLSLDVLKSARIQRETYPGIWLPEPIFADPPARDPLDRIGEYESLSIAFLHLLESLSPEERAVFLLREVFDYEYSDIAEAIDKSEAACRQLFSRARKHITDQRPRFSAPPEEHHALLVQFIQAVQEGDLPGLMALLTENVTSQGDGGGKALTIPHPFYGREAVSRPILSLWNAFKSKNAFEIAMVNGRESILIRDLNHQPDTLLSLDIIEGKVSGLYFVRNPDKLVHLTSQSRSAR